MSHVAVEKGGVQIRLSTKDLIINHCPDWEVMSKILMAMMEKNCSFFRDGRGGDMLENLFQTVLARVTATLIPLSAPSSPMEKQH